MTFYNPEQTLSLAREKQAWFAIWCFILVISLPLAVGIGTPLILLFPGSALVLAVFLYYRAPNLYIGFVFWISFLCPLIRRLIDYRSGYLTPGPWGFTAALVAATSLITVFRYLPVAHRKGGLPFILSLSAIGYACVVGITQNSLNAVMNGLFGWVCPVAFSFHIFMNWREYPKIKAVIIKTFLWGVLVMGVYGVLQYIFAPPWEQFWLNSIDAISFGQPVPFGIRVMSSSGSPQSFSGIILAGLILIFCESGNPKSYVASGFGYITLILSMARAVWLSAAISIPLFLLSLKSSYQIRMIVVLIATVAIVATALLSWEPVYDKFYTRFESLFDSNDVSLNARAEGYQSLFNIAIVQFLGRGIGFSTRIFEISLGANDSSFFPLIFTFGWLGLIFYLMGFFMLFIKLMQIHDGQLDIHINAYRIVTFSILCQAGFNSVFSGTTGIIMWSFAALAISGHKYYSYNKQVDSEYLFQKSNN